MLCVLRKYRFRIVKDRLARSGSHKYSNKAYYSGSIDGIYGWRTANAVKEFQRKNGLTADGISGPATLSKIGLPTGSSSSSYSNDTTLLAMVINGEARGESYEGQVAVGAVVLNRVRHSSEHNRRSCISTRCIYRR